MGTELRREALRLLVPGGLILIGTVWAARAPIGRAWMAQAGPALPWLVLAAAILLGWRFQRSRVVAVGLVLTLPAVPALYGLTATASQAADGDGGTLVLLAILLALAGLAGTRDRGLRSVPGVLQALLPALLVASAAWTESRRPGLALTVAEWPSPEAVARWSSLPWGLGDLPPALSLALIVALSALLVSLVLHRGPVERGLLLVAPLVVGAFAGTEAAQPTMILGAGLLLAVSVVETSYSLAYRDELTVLPTRRALKQALEGMGRPYALAMVDVDHFKRFNDRHGHDVGDQVLRMVASQLSKCGGGGKAFRYGGEEFTLLFPKRDREAVVPFLEEVRAGVEGATFRVRSRTRPRTGKGSSGKSRRSKAPKRQPRGLSVTVSIGVSDSNRADSAEAILKKADQALYRAKRAGRNRVAKG